MGFVRIVEVSPSTLTIDGDRIGNSVTIDRALMVPSGKNEERHDQQVPKDLADEREDEVDPGREQPTADRVAGAL